MSFLWLVGRHSLGVYILHLVLIALSTVVFEASVHFALGVPYMWHFWSLLVFVVISCVVQRAQINMWWQKSCFLSDIPSLLSRYHRKWDWRSTGNHTKIPYLKDLGVDVLWLSPVFPSPNVCVSRLCVCVCDDISDYCAIDPTMGTMNDMEDPYRNVFISMTCASSSTVCSITHPITILGFFASQQQDHPKETGTYGKTSPTTGPLLLEGALGRTTKNPILVSS